jgi:uncharacterized protein YcfJ
MKLILRATLTVVALAGATQAMSQITFFENDYFQGQTFATQRNVNNLTRTGFNDRASSVVVQGERWEVCEDVRFRGQCVVLRPGRYPSLAALGLNNRVSSVRTGESATRIPDRQLAPLPRAAQVIFFENEQFQGRTFTAEAQVQDFSVHGFNDRASSVVVLGDRWEVCSNSRYSGQCMVLNPGLYASLAAMGMNDRVSSVRAVDWNARVDSQRYAPAPVAVYDSRRRTNEQLYEARVTSARAVVGPTEQRCWVEQEQVSQDSYGPNMGGAVVGALIGGILGHQVGGGVGKDIATVGGAVAGAAVGANVGRNSGTQVPTTQNVQRCSNQPPQTQPAYWDVSYNFRGQDHRVQMTTAPGPTVTVNAQGEPRT